MKGINSPLVEKRDQLAETEQQQELSKLTNDMYYLVDQVRGDYD